MNVYRLFVNKLADTTIHWIQLSNLVVTLMSQTEDPWCLDKNPGNDHDLHIASWITKPTRPWGRPDTCCPADTFAAKRLLLELLLQPAELGCARRKLSMF